jgi:hypothetical protein
MTDLRPLPLGPQWKELLGFANRHSPELYESAEAVTDNQWHDALHDGAICRGISPSIGELGALAGHIDRLAYAT